MKVDRENPWDRKVMALSGKFSAETIARHTGLSPGQVNYRRKRFGLVQSRAFRAGKSSDAKALLKRYDALLGDCRALQRQINRILAS